jgi:hypothetical protein
MKPIFTFPPPRRLAEQFFHLRTRKTCPNNRDHLTLPFVNPITGKDLQDIKWYIETYSAHSLDDPDDREAQRIEMQLPVWGEILFNAAFARSEALQRFDLFKNIKDHTRLLTVSAEDPSILALPWELLRAPPAIGGFLFDEQPNISIRRRVAGMHHIREIYMPRPKDSLHLLFVISRPEDASFFDPRADSGSVLDAIDQFAPRHITYEFLRTPTVDALNDRLNDSCKPQVDILHFDGHGVFDSNGGMPEHKMTPTPDSPADTAYLLFENPWGRMHMVSADVLGRILHRHSVSLVILSACQSAAVGREESNQDPQPQPAMGSVAAGLAAVGVPSVLAMTYSVLVQTTYTLFGVFYKELARHKSIGEALEGLACDGRSGPGGVLRTATSSRAAGRFRLHAHGRSGRDHTGTEFSAPDLSLRADVLELGDGNGVFFREL